jgi:hypothetical protein
LIRAIPHGLEYGLAVSQMGDAEYERGANEQIRQHEMFRRGYRGRYGLGERVAGGVGLVVGLILSWRVWDVLAPWLAEVTSGLPLLVDLAVGVLAFAATFVGVTLLCIAIPLFIMDAVVGRTQRQARAIARREILLREAYVQQREGASLDPREPFLGDEDSETKPGQVT